MVRRRASSGSGVSASALAPRPSYLVSLLFTGLSFSQPGWGQYDDSATCYAPDGTAAASGAYLPCNYGAGVSASMCCASNGDMRSRRDTCTAGGLCLATDGSTQRGYCTDPTWKNPACLSLCVDGNASLVSPLLLLLFLSDIPLFVFAVHTTPPLKKSPEF